MDKGLMKRNDFWFFIVRTCKKKKYLKRERERERERDLI